MTILGTLHPLAWFALFSLQIKHFSFFFSLVFQVSGVEWDEQMNLKPNRRINFLLLTRLAVQTLEGNKLLEREIAGVEFQMISKFFSSSPAFFSHEN